MSHMTEMNLVPAIDAMLSAKQQLQNEHAQRITELNEGIRALRRLNTRCERCSGEGRVLRARACAEDDRPDPNNPADWKGCPECHGSGKANYREDEL